MEAIHTTRLQQVFGLRENERLGAKASTLDVSSEGSAWAESLQAATSIEEKRVANQSVVLETATDVASASSPRQFPADLGERSIAALKSACEAEGVSLEGIDISYIDDLVWSPTGSYYYPHIRLKLPDGQIANLGADLVMLNPKVGAYDVRQMTDPTVEA